MPARIYSLAKELKIDSKELVDLCTKAGITGKGSALASLDDDEIVRLKEFLGGRSRGSERTGPAAAGSATAVAAPPERKQTLTREQYIPPAGVSGKPPVLEPAKPEKPPEVRRRPLEPKPVTKPSPTVRLAQLPPSSAKAPTLEPPKPAEPVPQKPDLKLPADVVRASKAGAKPLSEHLKKAEKKKI